MLRRAGAIAAAIEGPHGLAYFGPPAGGVRALARLLPGRPRAGRGLQHEPAPARRGVPARRVARAARGRRCSRLRDRQRADGPRPIRVFNADDIEPLAGLSARASASAAPSPGSRRACGCDPREQASRGPERAHVAPREKGTHAEEDDDEPEERHGARAGGRRSGAPERARGARAETRRFARAARSSTGDRPQGRQEEPRRALRRCCSRDRQAARRRSAGRRRSSARRGAARRGARPARAARGSGFGAAGFARRRHACLWVNTRHAPPAEARRARRCRAEESAPGGAALPIVAPRSTPRIARSLPLHAP